MDKKIKIIITFFICIGLIASATAIAVRFDIISLEKVESIFTSVNNDLEDDIEDNNEDIDDIDEPITIPNKPPEAKFTYDNDLYTVTFMDQSSDIDNDKLSYLWDFGDEIISAEQNPIHVYDCSETNSFDITLTVSDGEFNDICTEYILFGPHLNILDYSQVWIWDDIFYEEKYGEYKPIWIGYISMIVENTGNMPAEISYARMETVEKSGDYPLHQCSIYFSFTYTYYEIIEDDEGGDGMIGSELGLWFLSNDTLMLNPGETVTLTSNPELTYITWGAGVYPVYIWLFEQKNGKDISHTMHETVLDIV